MARKSLAFCGLPAVMFASAAAQTADVLFDATVTETCAVVADSNGTLALNGTSDVLSSTEVGGSSGQATVTTNSPNFNVSIDAITGFTTGPADADTNTTFATLYDASGATTATDVDGAVPTNLGNGITTLTIDATATKSTGTFSGGTYQLTATVRCSV